MVKPVYVILSEILLTVLLIGDKKGTVYALLDDAEIAGRCQQKGVDRDQIRRELSPACQR
jgi:hypothetical protein